MNVNIMQKQTSETHISTVLQESLELLQYSTHELYSYLKEQEMENPLIELKDRRNQVSSASKGFSAIDAISSMNTNFRDCLWEEVKLSKLTLMEKSILKFIIYNLDDKGFLKIEEKYINEEIEKGIILLQDFGPFGIGARNIQESLLLQLKAQYPNEIVANTIIQNHFEHFIKKNWRHLSKTLKVSWENLEKSYELIKALNISPRLDHSNEQLEYVTPDIILDISKNGKFKISLNDSILPTIHLNNYYLELLPSSIYINEKYTLYKRLINNIEKRNATILLVTKIIIDKQKQFFDSGISSLAPLTLKDIATEIGMHESTISRATMNKIIQTPMGTFPLRKFFSTKIMQKDNQIISQSSVKYMLKSYISSENKIKPFSDQQIADYLKTVKGVEISRRAVTKYREELNIPSSFHRKELSK